MWALLLALGLFGPKVAPAQEPPAPDDGDYDDGDYDEGDYDEGDYDEGADGDEWGHYGDPLDDSEPGAASPASDPDDEQFGEALDPHGHWELHPAHGRVWVPRRRVVGHGWRPYSRGHWVYTDHGWTWVSEFSWGWAPFHYGRWFVWGGRWVWRPGRVWAPAWVAWRSHGEVVGWAPLGPATSVSVGLAGPGPDSWVFVPVGYLGTRHVWRHWVPRHRVRYYYGLSRPVYGVRRRGARVWYHGPRRRWVSARWRRPVPRVRHVRRRPARRRAIRAPRRRQVRRSRRQTHRRRTRRSNRRATRRRGRRSGRRSGRGARRRRR